MGTHSFNIFNALDSVKVNIVTFEQSDCHLLSPSGGVLFLPLDNDHPGRRN